MLRSRPTRLLLTVALVLGLFAVPVIISAQDVTPTVTVADQESDGASVTVPSTTAAVPGWMVIHADDGGRPGPVLGHTQVDAGTTDNVVVTLDQPLEGDTTLWAMLHVDEGEAGVYEFPGADVPARDGDAIVMAPFAVTVAPMADEAAMAETEAMTETTEMAPAEAMTETAEMAPAEAMTETAEMAPAEAMTETAEMAPAEAMTETAEMAPAEAMTETAEVAPAEAPTVLPVTGAGMGGVAAQLPAVLATLSALAGGVWISRRRRQ